MQSEIRTDRKKGNRVQDKERVIEVIQWLDKYGVKVVVKTHDWGHSHEIYQVHNVRKGKPCEEYIQYFASGETLQDVYTKLFAIVCLFQDKHISESPQVKNEMRFTWRIDQIE